MECFLGIQSFLRKIKAISSYNKKKTGKKYFTVVFNIMRLKKELPIWLIGSC